MHCGIQTLKLGWSSLWLVLAKYAWGYVGLELVPSGSMTIPMHIPRLNLYTRPTLVPTYLVCVFIYLPIYIPSYLGFQPTYLFAYLDYLPSYVGPQLTYLLAFLPRLPNILPWPLTQGPIYLGYPTFNLVTHIYGLCTHLGYLPT
jgi:hypothetical protein